MFDVLVGAVLLGVIAAVGGDGRGVGGTAGNAERKLIRDLLLDYDSRVRPVVSASQNVNVTIMLFLVRIVDVNEKSGVLTTYGWLHQEWYDAGLKWDPDSYDGIDKMRLPIANLWTPDVKLANNADSKFTYASGKKANVGSDGRVVWQPQVLLKSFCPIELLQFPYDTQYCTIRFGSWYYTTDAVNFTEIRLETTDPEHLKRINSPGWKVTRLLVKPNAIVFGVNKYAEMIVGVNLQRLSTYHGHLFILPGFFLSLLTMFIFLLPPDSGERITLGVGIILALSLMLGMMENYLPIEISSFPILGVHYVLTLSLCVIAMLLSIIILNFFHRDIRTNKLPYCIKVVLIDYLARFMLLKRHPYFYLEGSVNGVHDVSENPAATPATPTSPTPNPETTEDYNNVFKVMKPHQSQDGLSVRRLIITEWHQAALVLDRLLFVIYFSITIISVIILYSRHASSPSQSSE